MRITQPTPNLPSVRRGQPIVVHIDGRSVQAFDGETVAAVLLAEGVRALRRTAKTGEPRGIFCGMGTCFDCLVTVNGKQNTRACVTPVADGMVIETRPGVSL
jgi:predicted molibdopterin-dependent oxidoreductase YjgC